jgi:hypothetical protein
VVSESPAAARRDKPQGTVSHPQAAGFNPQSRSKTPAAAAAVSPAVLRPIEEADVEPIARWYDTAVLLAGSLAPLGKLPDSNGRRRPLLLTDSANQEPVGLILATLEDPEPGWATVNLLAIARQEERDVAALGVALLEAHLRGEATHIRAAVPADVGLALYFWLRLGYRPIVSGETLWLTRELAQLGGRSDAGCLPLH